MWPGESQEDWKEFNGKIDFGPKGKYIGKDNVKNVRYLIVKFKFRNDYAFIKSGTCEFQTENQRKIKTVEYGIDDGKNFLYIFKRKLK